MIDPHGRNQSARMGIVHVGVAVRNPADPGREWRAPFLVGTGAALESAGAEVDPRNRGLTKRSSLRLKGRVPEGIRDSAHAEAWSGRAAARAGRGKFRWRNMAGRAMRPSRAAASQGRGSVATHSENGS